MKISPAASAAMRAAARLFPTTSGTARSSAPPGPPGFASRMPEVPRWISDGYLARRAGGVGKGVFSISECGTLASEVERSLELFAR